jgi:putative cell wall-binding protein
MKALQSLLAAVALTAALAAAPAHAIPRDLVVARATVWANSVRSRDASGHPTAYGVPYSQKRWAKADGTLIPTSVNAAQARYLGWRTDCSGFVAMCWDLRDSLGRPQSPTTMDYRANPSRWYKIAKTALKPGDMMLVCAEWGAPYSHAVLFAGWADAAKTQYWAIEESSSKGGVVRRMTPYPYWGTAGAYYRPYRYASIQEDFTDVITNVSGGDAPRMAAVGSKVSFPNSAVPVPGLVVVSSETWADSLSAASLASAVRGPILLTPAHSLPASTAAEIVRLKPAKVYVMGSPSVIDATVASRIASLGAKVVRIKGPDRYATASIAATTGVNAAKARGVAVDTAYVVNGLDYVDAYATSPITVKTSRPILLAAPKYLPSATLRALAESHIATVVIVGNTSAVGTGVETALKSKGYKVRRIGGADHYAISRGLAMEGVGTGLTWTRAGIASDKAFTDTLVAGATQGACGSVLLLNPATSLNSGVGTAVLANRKAAKPMRAYGGYAGLSWSVRNAIAYRLRRP